MIKRLLLAIFGVLLLYISLFIFMINFNIIVFAVHVKNFPGGTVEIDDVDRHISKKDGYILFIQEIKRGADATLKCADSIDKDGYFTSGLNQFLYIEIDGCDIKYICKYDFLDPFMIILDYIIQIGSYIFA